MGQFPVDMFDHGSPNLIYLDPQIDIETVSNTFLVGIYFSIYLGGLYSDLICGQAAAQIKSACFDTTDDTTSLTTDFIERDGCLWNSVELAGEVMNQESEWGTGPPL